MGLGHRSSHPRFWPGRGFFLRIGEALQATRSDLVLPRDAVPGTRRKRFNDLMKAARLPGGSDGDRFRAFDLSSLPPSECLRRLRAGQTKRTLGYGQDDGELPPRSAICDLRGKKSFQLRLKVFSVSFNKHKPSQMQAYPAHCGISW